MFNHKLFNLTITVNLDTQIKNRLTAAIDVIIVKSAFDTKLETDMSHFTTIKVKIRNGELLHQVLEDLGYQVERNVQVRGYQGDRTNAEYVIRQPNGYDLGFRRSGEDYELVADFWGARIDRESFINSISQKYAYKSLMTAVDSQGFNVEEEETLVDGTVRVVVGRWI